MPVAEAKIPVTDWGYRRSDVTYDVVSVWDGAFFKLDDHLRRFRASMDAMRLAPRESDDDIRGILHELVRRTGLREAYVAMDCLRGAAPPNVRRHPSNARNYLLAYRGALCLADAARGDRARRAPDRRIHARAFQRRASIRGRRISIGPI